MFRAKTSTGITFGLQDDLDGPGTNQERNLLLILLMFTFMFCSIQLSMVSLGTIFNFDDEQLHVCLENLIGNSEQKLLRIGGELFEIFGKNELAQFLWPTR